LRKPLQTVTGAGGHRKGEFRWRWILAALLFIAVCCAGYLSYRFNQYRHWEAVYGDAFDAYQRAYDSRDGDSPLYLEKQRDFGTAMDALDRLQPFNEHAVLAKEKLRACAEELELYRRWLRLNFASLRLNSDTDFQAQRDAETAAGSCIRSNAVERFVP
jgi:hypothetical protein